MKKILIFLGVALFLLVIGIVIFIATFDADRYRPFVVEQLESALGKPVQLAHLSLEWKGGIALRLKDLSILEGPAPVVNNRRPGPQAGGEPIVRLESASALLRFMPLLKKNIEIVSITLVKPQLRMVRRPDGTLNTERAGAPQKKPAKEAAAVAFLVSEIAVQEGRFAFYDETQRPPREFLLQEIDIRLKNVSLTEPIELEHFSAKAFGGTIRMSGTVKQVTTDPQVVAEFALDNLALEALLPPPAHPDAPFLQGLFSASFQGTLQGKSWPAISQTLSGQGRLTVKGVVLRNVNVVRDLFQRLSLLPGLTESLEARLPESYRSKLASRDTKLLEPIDLPVAIQNGAMALQHVKIVTDSFELEGKGDALLNGSLTADATISIEKTLSEAAGKSASELLYLTNAKGQIEIPLKVEVRLPHVSILPDLSYVGSRLAVGKASEFLNRALGGKEDSQNGVGTVLQNLLNR